MTVQQQLRSYLETGIHAHKQGQIESARKAYESALVIAPENPDAMQLLGVALLQLGDAVAAVPYLERAARKLHDNAAVIGNLAQAYFNVGRFELAHEAFRKASRLQPRELHYQLGIGNSLAMQGKLADAEAALRRLSERVPQNALVHFNLGNALRDQGQAIAAAEQYRLALRFDPQMVEAQNNLAGQLQAQRRLEEAEREFRACIQMAPDYLLAQCNFASVLIDMGRFTEAEQVCRTVIERNPNLEQAHTFLGAALGHQGRLWDAVACHHAAAEIAGHDPKLLENYAGSLTDVGEFNEGLVWFLRTLELNPQSISARQTLGMALLGQGLLNEGWTEYTYRPARLRFEEKYPHLALSKVLPDDLFGKHICILREQGLGDEIFFLRYAPQLHAAGARLTYRSSNKLRSILERSSYFEDLLEEMAATPAADTIIMAGDLPHALSRYPSSRLSDGKKIEHGAVYPELVRRISVYWPEVPAPLQLTPLEQRMNEMRDRLAHAGEPPYLGLTWQGGIAPHEQQSAFWSLYKRIAIAQLAAAVTDFPGTYIALQRNPAPGEIESFSAAIGRPVHDFTDLNEDLESMLALVALIDEYVGVSNTNMHLRAGVGKTARVLVPRPAEWRWMTRGRESPWFPGFSLYRQTMQGSWDNALRDLARDLSADAESSFSCYGKSNDARM